jgi:ATP-dependent protease ClpP protease subunit
MRFFRHLATALFLIMAFPAHADSIDCLKLKPLVGEITAETFTSLNDAIDCLDAGFKTVQIVSSPGGDTEFGFGSFDRLTEHQNRKQLTTIAYGNVASAAVMVFLAGHERLMSCNSTIFLHEPYNVLEAGVQTISDLAHLSKNIERTFLAMVKIHAKETGQSEERIKALSRANTTLTAKEAVRLGFATGTTKKCD